MKNGQVLVGLVAGAAVGAALGILFAPKSGAELRKDIADKSGDALKNLKGKIAGKASELMDKGKEVLEDGISKLEGGKSENSKLQTGKKENPAY